MEKFFSFLGKTVLVLVGVGILVVGGYYLGTKGMQKNAAIVPSPPTPTTLPQSVMSSSTPTQVVKPTGRFAVNAGGIKPFSAYMLSGVAGWAPVKTHDTNAGIDKIVLSKALYSMTILQGPIGGGGCTFPGEKPQEMSVQLSSSLDIPLLTGSPLRRGQAQSPTPTMASFTICQKTADGSYSTFTDFGVINYSTPLSPDTAILSEMDAMVGSLQKQ